MSILSERGSNACTVTRAVVSVGKLQIPSTFRIAGAKRKRDFASF